MSYFVNKAFTLIECCDGAVADLIARARYPMTPDEFVSTLIDPISNRTGYEPRVLQSLIAIISAYFADSLSPEMQAKLHALDTTNVPAGVTTLEDTTARVYVVENTTDVFNVDKTALTFNAVEVNSMNKTQIRAVVAAIEDLSEIDYEQFLHVCPVPTMNELIRRGYRVDMHVYLTAQLQRIADEVYAVMPDANMATVHARLVHKWPRAIGDNSFGVELMTNGNIRCSVETIVRYSPINTSRTRVADFSVAVKNRKINFD